MSENSRFPSNLQGLLRFALQNTKAEDAPNSSNFEQMDEERQKFLEDALKSMTVDVIVELEKSLNILENDESSVKEKVEAIEIMQDYADNLDFANNFVKIGGSKVIISCLSADYPELKSAAAKLLAEMSQNNPFCQEHFLDIDLLPKYIELLADEEKVASSAMHGISCLVRGFEPALAAFIKIGGLECVLGCLQSKNEKLFVKSCFLISTLSTEFTSVRDELIKLDTVEKLVNVLTPSGSFDVRLEMLLSALNVLTECDGGLSRISSSSFARPKLEEIVKITKGKSECQEINGFSETILNRCLASNEDVADR